MVQIIFVLVAIHGLAFSSQTANSSLSEFDWLAGTWERKTKNGRLYERWSKVSSNTLEGKAYTKKDGTEKIVEHLRLQSFGNEIFYIPKVAHNKYPIPFKLAEASKSRWIFVHEEHDFPQSIIYMRQTNDKMQVRIEGISGTEKKSIDFHFTRVE